MSESSTSARPKYRPVYAALAAIYGPDEDVISTLREMDAPDLGRLHRAVAYLTDKCESECQDRGDRLCPAELHYEGFLIEDQDDEQPVVPGFVWGVARHDVITVPIRSKNAADYTRDALGDDAELVVRLDGDDEWLRYSDGLVSLRAKES